MKIQASFEVALMLAFLYRITTLYDCRNMILAAYCTESHFMTMKEIQCINVML